MGLKVLAEPNRQGGLQPVEGASCCCNHSLSLNPSDWIIKSVAEAEIDMHDETSPEPVGLLYVGDSDQLEGAFVPHNRPVSLLVGGVTVSHSSNDDTGIVDVRV
jgi:hypothetical protein